MTTEQEKELVDAFIGGLCNPPAESDEADITNLTVDIDHDTALLLRKISSETGQPLQDLLNEAFELGLTAKLRQSGTSAGCIERVPLFQRNDLSVYGLSRFGTSHSYRHCHHLDGPACHVALWRRSTSRRIFPTPEGLSSNHLLF